MLMQMRSNETDKARTQLKECADKINGEIISGNKSAELFQDAFENLIMPQGVQGCILDVSKQNQTLAPTQFLNMRFYDSAIENAMSGSDGVGFNLSKKDIDVNNTAKEWLTYAVLAGDNSRYIIYTRIDASPINENLSKITMTIFFMVIIGLVLSGVLGFLLSNALTRPIIELTRVAKAMAGGDLNQNIKVYSNDEIGQLSQTITEMAQEINQYIITSDSEKNKMETILHNMTDGVLAYDSGDTLIHANSASEELLNLGDLKRIPAKDVMNYLGFEDGIDQKESTIATGDKFILSTAAYYLDINGNKAGVVVVIQDVTKMTKLDNMRKEFVANVSHELRTPLTTVKTYTETLLDGAMNDAGVALDFLKVIDSESQRMALLVQDLLELSKLDNKQLKLDLEVLDLNALICQCVKQNVILAEKKHQSMIFTPLKNACFIEADVGRINQVLTNIISNAVKYSPAGASIEISLEDAEAYFRLFVKDNGMGIPREDLRRIFERFYRVDKARSRAMGGTGLGLAIAKEIMEAHNFRITANSELGKGTTMILRFDKLRVDGETV
ncbi:MAG: cell wall metabolism sensor histidine kinase WalK [Clostridiales bacterium]|nr:cell wall metabolism sensor histidine kinase WalK [Clostridiales bacterium]